MSFVGAAPASFSEQLKDENCDENCLGNLCGDAILHKCSTLKVFQEYVLKPPSFYFLREKIFQRIQNIKGAAIMSTKVRVSNKLLTFCRP